MHVCSNPDSYLKTCFSPLYCKTPCNSFQHWWGGGGTVFKAFTCCGPPFAWQSNKAIFSPLPKTLSLHFNLAPADRSQILATAETSFASGYGHGDWPCPSWLDYFELLSKFSTLAMLEGSWAELEKQAPCHFVTWAPRLKASYQLLLVASTFQVALKSAQDIWTWTSCTSSSFMILFARLCLSSTLPFIGT